MQAVKENIPFAKVDNTSPSDDTVAARRRSLILKACIFATGLSGIVSEYVLSTLASYLLGNAVLQWTLTLSFMLFAMGIGSRLSKHIQGSLFDAFVTVEFILSVLCAICALTAYVLAAYIADITLIIYLMSIMIGVLIGLEIPIATRLNDHFEELRVNISSVMEHDYYGALLGGILFAFFALPKLGLTYTPILLGSINFLVAATLFVRFRHLLVNKRRLTAAALTIPVFLVFLAYFAEPIVLFGEQQKYRDRVIYEEQTPYQRIVMTQWKDNFWLYLNGNEQFSSYDEELYHEPLVHPAMALCASHKKVLILGGGDGLAVREVLKYRDVESVKVVDLDPAMTNLSMEHPKLVSLNRNSLANTKVSIVNEDAYVFLRDDHDLYDVIIVDLPDPKTVGLARLYSRQFYATAVKHLAKGGTLVTQATSPSFSRDAFLSILKSMRAAGIPAIALRNHVPTMGEWGWVLGQNLPDLSSEALKQSALKLSFDGVETRFLNQEAMQYMLSFGKGLWEDLDTIKVNDELDLAVYYYYQDGSWDIY